MKVFMFCIWHLNSLEDMQNFNFCICEVLLVEMAESHSKAKESKKQ